MATFVDDDVTAIGLRVGDPQGDLQDLQIILPVTVALKGGGAVHALLCRRSYTPIMARSIAVGGGQLLEKRAPLSEPTRFLVYYDRNADRMVVHPVEAKLLGQWLARLGV